MCSIFARIPAAFILVAMQLAATVPIYCSRILQNSAENDCPVGFIRGQADDCVAFCQTGCPAYATCVWPNQCQCKLGYIDVPNHYGELQCQTLCNEAYTWNSKTKRCEQRCSFANITWDPLQKVCVERPPADIDLIAINHYTVRNPPEINKKLASDLPEWSHQYTSYMQTTTEAAESNELSLPLWFNLFAIILSLTLLAIAIASTLWRLYLSKIEHGNGIVDAFKSTLIMYEERELERSQIMVY